MTAAQYYQLEQSLSAADETFDEHFTLRATPDAELRDSIRRLLMVVTTKRIRSEQSEHVAVEDIAPPTTKRNSAPHSVLNPSDQIELDRIARELDDPTVTGTTLRDALAGHEDRQAVPLGLARLAEV